VRLVLQHSTDQNNFTVNKERNDVHRSSLYICIQENAFHPSLHNVYVQISVYTSVEPSKLDSGDDWLRACPGY
jgi:hypothetical protein